MDHSTLHRCKVVVVDDSVELLEVFKFILEKKGYEVITKRSAADIFLFLLTTRIDILVMDVRLNGTNGREVCKQLKLGPQSNYFPVILMSASPEYLLDFAECKADGIIEKPFDINKVVKKINSFLYKHSLK